MTDYSASRRYPRVEAAIPIRLSTIEPERDPWTGRQFFRATQETSGNLSRGGAFVRTLEPLAPGRRLLVELQLPNGRQLETFGRVAWSKKVVTSQGREGDSGVGIEFIGGSEQLSELERFIVDEEEPGGGSSAES
jgi:hypothetical protein